MPKFANLPDEISLNWVTLSFQEDLEKEFQEDYFYKSLTHVRISMLLAMLIYSLFGILDISLIPEHYEEFWFIRFAVFAPFTFAIFLLSFWKRYQPYMQLSIAVIVLVAGLGIVEMIVIAPEPVNYSYYAGLILVFIYGYTFFKLRFIWATLTGWMIVIAYEIAAISMMHTPFSILINNNFFFLSGNIIGMFACYSIEYYTRSEFIHTRLLKVEKEKVNVANSALEKRVEERTSQLRDANEELKRESAERKKVDDALIDSEQRLRSLTENSPEIIYTLGKNGSFTYINPACEKILGRRPEEFHGKYFIDFGRKEDASKYVNLFKRIRDVKETIRDEEGILLHKDGSERIFTLSGAPNINSEGKITGMVGFLKDISVQQQLQNQLQQAQKMEAVGTLAGGIAHDFNNLLQVIRGYSELMLLHKQSGDNEYRELQEIKRASLRAAELTQQLLTFSRKVESKLRPTELNKEVKQAYKLLQRIIPKMIEMKLNLEKDLDVVNADPAQIEQILLNFAVNARDAMPEGGQLLIKTENVFLGAEYCKTQLDATPGFYVKVSVTDTGYGMSQETLERIFEPFYTTKETGKGTGLGLANVYGIVKSHGGHITCSSRLGEGTTFDIYLPAIERSPDSKEVRKEKMPEGGTETILLVDDEPIVRELGSDILSKFGYTVLTATDGEHALDMYQSKREEIDLVILDLIMPKLGGVKCLEKLVQINPTVKVVIASGYSVKGPMQDEIEARSIGFINKPYDIKQMLETVRTGLTN